MKSTIQFGRVSAILCCLVVGAMIAPMVHATDPACYRYITTTATETQINATCAEQLGITPIFVREAIDGYDIMMPLGIGTTAPYNLLATASVEWLAAGSNLERMKRVINFAENTSDLYASTSDGGITKNEYVNYTLASWLNTSGATAAIASMANASLANNDPPDPAWGSNCPALYQAHKCSSCQWWHCSPDWIDAGRCHCDLMGTTCCVIGIRLEAPSE